MFVLTKEELSLLKKLDTPPKIQAYLQYGCWGAVSKTNHAVLRYREPIHRTLRELALSFFHEYFNADGYKTLRSYSRPVNLSRFDEQGWVTDGEDVWFVERYLYDVKHYPLLNRTQISSLKKPILWK